MRARLRAALVAAAFVALSTVAAAGARAQGSTPASRSGIRPRTMYEDLQLLSGVLNQLRVNHPDSLDTHRLMMAAIRGMLSAADPHSYIIEAIHLDPEKEKEMREGKLYPVPVSFSFYGGSPVVMSVAPGSSAAKADILPGDDLIAIDGQPVVAESEEELDLTLYGRKNSTVKLTVERRRVDGSYVTLEREVKREKVGEQTAVPVAVMLDGQTGYVRITTFENDKVAEDLNKALGRLEDAGMQRLVLDIRDNGGGLVHEAADVAGVFLPGGTIVYTSEGRKADVADTGRVKNSFFSTHKGKKYPIVLLVNAGTASASELLAGALQDHDRATIVGQPTFGKSLMMQGFPLPDGSVVVMVIGLVRTPCGRIVQREYRGVTRRDYYRLARADRDTVGRPSCKTDAGRTVYGGGGIYPDVRLPTPPGDPLWLARVHEQSLLLRWTGGYLTAHATAFPSLDSLVAHPALPADAIPNLRAFASSERVTIPDGADADEQLRREILEWVAETKWGEEGWYRVSAMFDDEVKKAIAAFSTPLAAGS
ncbi:MAG TPA: S41 family peptidase [Gemmatimonadaceae bacterium]|nr:S41 family peptidase [Gemmatimonadaceae bacterium]